MFADIDAAIALNTQEKPLAESMSSSIDSQCSLQGEL